MKIKIDDTVFFVLDRFLKTDATCCLVLRIQNLATLFRRSGTTPQSRIERN